MALVEMDFASGGGNATLKDVYRDIVLNSSLTKYSLTIHGDRCTLTEGAWVNDTTHKTIYVYADFTINGAQSSSTNQLIMILTSMTTDMRPYVYNSSALRGDTTLTTDDSSSNTNGFVTHYFTSPTGVGITLPTGLGAADGDHYIVYGSWNY